MKYQWILFDADNTLFDFDQSERFAFAEALKQVGIPFIESQFKLYHSINKSCWRAFEDGLLKKEDLRTARFEQFFKAIDKEADPLQFSELYLTQLSHSAFMLEGSMALLEELSDQYKMAIITNGLKEVQRPRITKAGLSNIFDVIVVSDEIGHAKPHPSFFDYTFNEMRHPDKEEVLVVGDNLNSDIKGGKDYGVDTCWYNHLRVTNESEVVPTYEVHSIGEVKEILK